MRGEFGKETIVTEQNRTEVKQKKRETKWHDTKSRRYKGTSAETRRGSHDRIGVEKVRDPSACVAIIMQMDLRTALSRCWPTTDRDDLAAANDPVAYSLIFTLYGVMRTSRYLDCALLKACFSVFVFINVE
ncbi:hypothetical protein GWI33_013931 [Rhynchophorus ferrugineus]|uniref:Uncharacterized protein n=1 Tax=Rhynchophorus ferrugineus TaxID=354439 RepID=A0A834M9I7_RHYFE|nr:hypothetical protein GWI33_013931 [Rhynchophorus ferrugineus]